MGVETGIARCEKSDGGVTRPNDTTLGELQLTR
jgi:hypothetical protein